MSECELLATCGFFRKYQDSLNMACRGFISLYCRGALQGECRRREFRMLQGKAPDEDMMPNGQVVPPEFRGKAAK